MHASAYTGFVVKRHGERFPSVFFQMGSGERTKLGGSRAVHQGGAMGLGLLCLPLLPVLMSVREEHESRGVEAYACLASTAPLPLHTR